MKAYVLHSIGDIRLEDVTKPQLNDGEVLVEVIAAGVCGSDIPRIYKTGAHTHPLIPGHEFAGKVVQTGRQADGKWMDKRVGVFPLIPCGTCMPCRNKQYEMCRNYSYLGSRTDGGFAEYVAVPQDNLIELPDNVSYEAGAMLEPMAVAVHAMRRAAFTQDDIVVVYGLGTIGLLLTMFLKEHGLKNILMIGNKEFQKQQIQNLGIDINDYCDSRNTDTRRWVLEKTGGQGADVLFECVGRNETVTEVVNSAAPAGKIVMVGNPYSDMQLSKDIYWKILRNQITVMGTWNSSFTHSKDDDWNYVIDRLEQGSVTPEKLISHRFPLDELEKGFRIMRDKEEDYVKIMGMCNEKEEIYEGKSKTDTPVS